MRSMVFGIGVALVIVFAGQVVAAPAPEFVVVHIEVADPAEAAFLEQWIDVWAHHVRDGIVDAAVDPEGEQVLRDFGFRFEIDAKLTEKYNRPFEYPKRQLEGIPNFPCYRTVEETLADGAGLAATYPDLAEWIDIGDSWEKVTPGGNEGYNLMVLRLTNTTNGIPSAEKPKLWVMGAIHAREYVTAETVTRFAEHVLANYDIDPDITWVLDHHELHLLLVTNPDGRKKAEAGALWRKNTNEDYCGAFPSDRGADLNRNCDFYWQGSSDQCGETYPGPYVSSEPETQAMQNWVIANFPDWRPIDDLVTPAPDDASGIFIDVHSYGQEVLTALVFQAPPAPNDAQILRLARKFTYFTSYDALLGGTYGSGYSGTTKDFGYGRLGLPAFTFELGTTFFQSCAPFESTIYPDNLESLLYAARAVRAPYTQSSGPEVVTPSAAPMVASPGETVMVTAVIDDTRYGPGTSSPPVSIETIAAAEIFIDVPPWQVGAAPIAMSAVDGAFDNSSEAVTASFSSTGLVDGRHTIYLRGQDGAGYWGTVRAAFVWVLDPSTAAHISGRLTDAVTGLPVQGAITAGIFSTASGPATGSYDLLVPDGTYDVTAAAEGYEVRTVTDVIAVSGATTNLDFVLTPFETVLDDDVESGNLGWTTEGFWAITSEASASPSHSWTESPGGDYGDDWNYSLISPVLDLTNVTGVVLEFSHTYALESGYDYGYVEVSTTGGSTWTTVTSYNGFQTPSWERVVLELPSLDHASTARVRFRIETDVNTTEDGWHIDDIVVMGTDDLPPGLLFRDQFESGDTSGWSATSP